MEQVVVRRLRERGQSVATAESCTGGLIANRLTNVPGASAVFGWGFVTYANEAKQRALGVPADLIARHGAVSEPVARAMAEGALRCQRRGPCAGRHRRRRTRRRHRGETGRHRLDGAGLAGRGAPHHCPARVLSVRA